MTVPALDQLAHYAFVKGLLAGLPASMTLYEGQVPGEPSFPYVVLRMDTGFEAAERLCGTSNRADFRFTLTSVGITDASARVVAGASRSLVLDVRPVVAARLCTPIRKETSLPIQPDNDVMLPASNLHPMFGVDGYHFVSYAA
ncbi:MAG TPA: hypothetical protein VJT49_14810 [Amycolatopsis sp.]|uniref:hypothetical protein n=1 Tax=Amycolatopsis sp. TaxID=37632 RepID=UPI002B4A60AE|nr:hypothetical protein [Amycolatopsis sp.]HKS46349.1 hypothetical protein [Amycolatopsis sp.]